LFNDRHDVTELSNKAEEYKLNRDITITGAIDEVVDISKYYRFFNGETSVTVKFTTVDTNERTASLTITANNVTYNVCFEIDGVLYKTNYRVTVGPAKN
jgi:hypothetical protein